MGEGKVPVGLGGRPQCVASGATSRRLDEDVMQALGTEDRQTPA